MSKLIKYKFHQFYLSLIFILGFAFNINAQNHTDENNIFIHPATPDTAWHYNGNETYTSTGNVGTSGLKVPTRIYEGDEVTVSFNIDKPTSNGHVFARVDGKKVYLPHGETKFFHVFKVETPKTSDIRIATSNRLEKGITLSNIEFNLKLVSQENLNTPPIADAGSKMIGASQEVITLDASKSTDKESELTFEWKQIGNYLNKIDLLNQNSAMPQFITPDLEAAETVNFELTVTDSQGLKDTDTVSVIIYPNNLENIFYHPATEDKAWLYNGNETYISTGDNGGSGLRVYNKVYKSDQVLAKFTISSKHLSGSLFARIDSQKAYLEHGESQFYHLFTINSEETTDLRIGAGKFPYSGVELFNIEFLHISTNPEPLPNTEPTANAGETQTVTGGDSVILDGTGSGDLEGTLAYQWKQIDNSGITVNLINDNTDQASFIVPISTTASTFSFELTVIDAEGLTDNATVDVLSLPGLMERFTPSEDTNIIYVSNTYGDDSKATPIASNEISDPMSPTDSVTPFKTLKAAMSHVRDGFPDWILLKRGETWTNESFGKLNKSGKNINERILFSYYGVDGDRPIIKTGPLSGILANNRMTSHIAIVGLDFYAHTRDPHSPDYIEAGKGETGLAFVGGGDNILIEDTVIRYFKNGVTVQSFDEKIYTNFTFKQSSILNSYSIPGLGHSSGLYIEGVDGILIEDSFFDHNGWNESIADATATKFNHNVYMQTSNIGENIIVRNNIISRGSSHGMHGRAGGFFENNLFISNSIGLQLGYKTTPLLNGTLAHARDNVILSGKLMDPTGQNSSTTKAVWGLYTESNALDEGGEVLVENNIVANAVDHSNSNLDYKKVSGGEYEGNISYNWNAESDNFDPKWKNPNLSIEDYMTSIGEEPSLEEFINILSTRKLNSWNTLFTASEVNRFIRSGFNQ